MAQGKSVAFEQILKQERSFAAWKALQKQVPESDLVVVKRRLLAIANGEHFFDDWHPPTPRHARRFADHLVAKVVPKVRQMNLHFAGGLPLADPRCGDLPEILEWYTRTLREASRSRKKQRESVDVPEAEVEILRLLDQSSPGVERHNYEEAADLIQAAYDAGNINRTVDAVQLRKLYDRQSLKHRLITALKQSPGPVIGKPDS